MSFGGHELDTDRELIRVAFERPTARGFENHERAVTAAKTHIRNQFFCSGSTSIPTSTSIRQPRRITFQPPLATMGPDLIADVVHAVQIRDGVSTVTVVRQRLKATLR
jgi:hypothetical protein